MDHPNIIAFEHCFEDEGNVYMQLELCAQGVRLDYAFVEVQLNANAKIIVFSFLFSPFGSLCSTFYEDDVDTLNLKLVTTSLNS